MVLCISPVIDHRQRQNVVQTIKKSGTRGDSSDLKFVYSLLNKKKTIQSEKLNRCNTDMYMYLRWLTTVFRDLISACYETLPHVSICRTCKNDASNLKK